jgi:hypothetical protein
MVTERKIWRNPALNEVSVKDVLAMGTPKGAVLGPPGWASPGPLITGAETPFGPPGIDLPSVFGPPIDLFVTTLSDGPPLPVSDIRLKEDVAVVGVTAHGLPLYTFRYRGQTGVYEGVMAQDVIDVRPDAVAIGADGFYRVDYAKLGIECRRID